jgi:hypothetical protein
VWIEIGIFLALGGCVAGLAGLTSMRRARALRSSGMRAWGLVVASPADPEDPGRPARLALVQYALPDGRVLERTCPRQSSASGWLMPGQRVLIFYDPANPGEVLVHGRDGGRMDLAFVWVGLVFIASGAALATLAH